MVLSKQCEYGIRAMAFLAVQEPDRLIPIREIGRAIDIPLPFLSKILGALSRHRLVKARRGPHGGVMLGRPPGRVSLASIVEALDGKFTSSGCYLGLSRCSPRAPCPIRRTWTRVCREMNRVMRESTLEDLVGRRPRARASKRS